MIPQGTLKPPLVQSNGQRCVSELCRDSRSHGPTHDPAGIQIYQHCHIELALPRRNTGQVAGPLLIAPRGDEIALQHIRGNHGRSGGASPPHASPAADASNPVQAHKPRYPLTTDPGKSLRVTVMTRHNTATGYCAFSA